MELLCSHSVLLQYWDGFHAARFDIDPIGPNFRSHG